MSVEDAPGSTPPAIAYGIDIGVYRHRADGTLRSRNTFAWARAESTVRLCPVRREKAAEFCFEGSYRVGRDIRELTKAIKQDLNREERIAIGIEAPMWQPAPVTVPEGAFDLFPIRFPQEQGFAWYLQSGASALARALSTGRLLFSLLDVPHERLRCSTIASADSNVELFEGFVVDRWKLDAAEQLAQGPHAWDALTAAVAFHYSKCDQGLIHRAASYEGTVMSHWQTILQSSGFDGTFCSSDCTVVGFDSTRASSF